MLALRTTILLCGRQSSRTISLQRPRLDRFSRESLRNRLHRQELKESIKIQRDSGWLQQPDSVPTRPPRDLLKALGFTVGIGVTTFTVASIVDWQKQKKKVNEFINKKHEQFFSVKKQVNNSPARDLTTGETCAFTVMTLNAFVTILWQLKRLKAPMWRYFSNSFASKSLCSPMLLSVFSHSSLIHFGLNMYVMHSFTTIAVDKFLGGEQFWAFYLTAGVVSSLTSLVHKAAIRSPIRALGASGAILGLLTYTCCKIPDARLKIVFVPGFDFTAQSAVIGLIVFDLAGLVFRFRLFDHAAHLGGALFGIAYATWGEQFVWGCCRKHIQKAWHRMTSAE